MAPHPPSVNERKKWQLTQLTINSSRFSINSLFYLKQVTKYSSGTNKQYTSTVSAIDLFTDTVAILNSIVSNSYYGMLRG